MTMSACSQVDREYDSERSGGVKTVGDEPHTTVNEKTISPRLSIFFCRILSDPFWGTWRRLKRIEGLLAQSGWPRRQAPGLWPAAPTTLLLFGSVRILPRFPC